MVYCSGDLRFYLSALEEERSKIHVFRRELPLCYEVVNQTIEAWKKKLIDKDDRTGECDHGTSMDQPILDELMPPRADDVVGEEDDDDCDEEEETKSCWLRSARLWNPIPDLNTQQDHGEDPRAVLPEKPPSSAAEASTSPEKRQVQQGRDNTKALEKQTAQRKQRRCWSEELHHRFLKALQELGGPHAATPKHIKERMKVDGLTNDEIKSHLQKYRLHDRRSPSIQHDDNPAQAQAQARPQLVIVGGIWMPPSDFTAVTGNTLGPPTNKIYAPAADSADVNQFATSLASTYTITYP